MDENLLSKPLLVLISKSDLLHLHNNTTNEVVDKMGLTTLLQNRKWLAQSCCMINGPSVKECLSWLLHQLR